MSELVTTTIHGDTYQAMPGSDETWVLTPAFTLIDRVATIIANDWQPECNVYDESKTTFLGCVRMSLVGTVATAMLLFYDNAKEHGVTVDDDLVLIEREPMAIPGVPDSGPFDLPAVVRTIEHLTSDDEVKRISAWARERQARMLTGGYVRTWFDGSLRKDS